MTDRTISVSKKSGPRFGDVDGYLLTVTLPENATRWDVSAAIVELLRLDPFVNETAPCCGVPPGVVHSPNCLQAPANLIDSLREEAGLV